jgi:putative CocE/NonD family hydrolase
MKLAAALLVIVAMTPSAWGQQLLLPDAASRDDPALTHAFADFARQTSNTELAADANAKFILQLAAGSYQEAIATATARRKLLPSGAGPDPSIRLELYARVKAAEAGGSVDPERAFRKAFSDLVSSMDDKTALSVEYFLKARPWFFQRGVDQALARHQIQREMAHAEALELMDLYFNVKALQSFAPWLDSAIAADDVQRYVIDTDVLIKTKEGVTLSAVVVRKKGITEPVATSLSFNIQTDIDYWLNQAKTAAIHGYVGVVADPRGKRLSPDEIAPWEHEAGDTYAVIDWISKQPWSNGKVGMYGLSYAGFTQWAAAKSLHPALKTIVPAAASSPGFGAPMQNNVVQYVQYAWPFYVMNNKTLDDATYYDFGRWKTLREKWFSSGRPFREIDAIDGTPNKLLQQQLQHPSIDKYWQAMQPFGKDYARINIPVLTLTGYYDDANAAAVNYLVDHYRYNKKADHYLVIGPYDHSGTAEAFKPPVLMGYEIDAVAQIDSIELTYQWFDYVMRGAPKPALIKDRINYQLMGANIWKHAPSIDAMSTQHLKLYLSAAKDGERYRLSSSQPAEAGSIAQTVDLADRTSQLNLYDPVPISKDEPQANVMAFVSEPFDSPVSVSGMITGRLDAATNKRDMDFTLSFYELMPDGRRFHLSYYLGRASYARDMSKRVLLAPGRRTLIPFERTPLISRRMSVGSRLLVLLTVNKNSFAQVNYGTGKDVSDESIADAKEPLQVRWYNDSYVTVPIER